MFKRMVLGAALLIMSSAVFAAPASLLGPTFTGIYVFGDSLSDAGNVKANLGLPVAPYDNGYFSNGPVWVQTLADELGLGTTTASSLGGTNYAWGSARTSSDIITDFGVTIPSLGSQATQYLMDTGGIAQENGLYVVWGGGNDVLGGVSGGSAGDIADIVDRLAEAGATQFLVPNLPDIGQTPQALGAGTAVSAALTAATIAHNAALEIELAGLMTARPDITIHFFDVFALFAALIDDPAAFGFSIVDMPCFTGATGIGGGDACTNPEDYVFWDGIHPTASAHAFLGRVVPIPAALPLLLSGLGVFGLLRRRRA